MAREYKLLLVIQIAFVTRPKPSRALDLSPRKRPTQRRSQETVQVIMRAAAYILERDGWGGFTTNRVAERAGVNIGSLYQYFPNKEAILEALRRAHVEESRAAVFAALAGRDDPTLALVRGILEAHRVAPRLHRIFTEELPRHAVASVECTDDPALRALVRPLFAQHEDPDLALFVAVAALHAVIHDAACHRPEMLNHPGFEAHTVALARHCLARR